MPDIPNRDELEAQYARLMAKLLQAYGGRLLEKLGDPPSLDNLPADFWDEEARELAKALSPFGQRVYLEAAERLLTETTIGVDWALVNQGAVEWARQYTFDLVSGLTDTTREAVSSAVSDFFSEGLTRGELEDMLEGVFGPVRAEMIAVTEVTRASTEGEKEIARELAEQGIVMVPIWQTNNDELVCEEFDGGPGCGPRHGQVIEDDIYPPLHPRCRCWTNHELPKAEA